MASESAKGESDDNSSLRSSQRSDDDYNGVEGAEEVAPAPPKRKSKRAKSKKEDGESSNDTAATVATVYQCRFVKSQALTHELPLVRETAGGPSESTRHR